MTTRREILAWGGSLLLLNRTGWAGNSPSTGSTAEQLVVLPGKKPLIHRSFRPPNFETPLAGLRHAYTPNDLFFVRYHLANIPEVNPREWKLRIGGTSASRSLELSLADLKRRFKPAEVVAINQCSGNRRGLFTPRVPGVQWQYGAMGNARWNGIRLRDVLNAAGIKADAVEVVCEGADAAVMPATPDYTKSLPIDRALDEDTLIAFEMNGAPLPHLNGAPARLVVPGWTATYWIKHLTAVHIEPKTFDGFWMKSAYRIPTGAFPGARFTSQENAETTPITDIMLNSLVTSHISGDKLKRGITAHLKGWAWDGGSGIAAVEVSADGGRSWQPATLEQDLGRFAWQGFSVPVDTSRLGTVNLSVRAVSRGGARQTDKLIANPSGYHHNIIQSVSLEVV